MTLNGCGECLTQPMAEPFDADLIVWGEVRHEPSTSAVEADEQGQHAEAWAEPSVRYRIPPNFPFVYIHSYTQSKPLLIKSFGKWT